MEPLSTLIEGERNFFSEESDFMSHLFTNFSTKLHTFQDSSAFWPHNESINETSVSLSDNITGNMPYLLQENSFTDGNDSVFFPTSSGDSYLSVSCSRGSRKGISGIPSPEYNNLSLISRKHSCSLEDLHTSWKKTKVTKSKKLVSEVNIDVVKPDADHDSYGVRDVSPRTKGFEMLNTNGKKRASSGSAIDSQSVYAKKRREKINERLRILQNLVPNGTKVDISTMLEEAVEYVKFLQLQIKLLSSDDLWMYAPIAYNGMDLGLHVDIPSPR